MVCKNTEWDSKICPGCKYDICMIRYRHNLKPEDVVGISMKLNIFLSKPITEEFSNKLRSEFSKYVLDCVTKNNLISIDTASTDTINIRKD